MLEELIKDLHVIIRVVATMGFITFGAFIAGIEYKFYKDHYTDSPRNKTLFSIVVATTIFVWIFIYVVVFKGFKLE